MAFLKFLFCCPVFRNCYSVARLFVVLLCVFGNGMRITRWIGLQLKLGNVNGKEWELTYQHR